MKVAIIATTVFYFSLSIVGVVAIFPQAVFAKNCGVYGSIYSISEQDMLNAIYTKLSLMQESGELQKQKKAFIARSISHILRPTPVLGVSDLKNQTPKYWLFNPAIVLNHAITNVTGDVIASAGKKVNPLKFRPFNEALIFIDGDDQNQINWTEEKSKNDSKKYSAIKIILVNGDINQTAKVLGERVYFDQNGVLCKRFGITHTPTMVYQAEINDVKIPRLMIKEFSDA